MGLHSVKDVKRVAPAIAELPRLRHHRGADVDQSVSVSQRMAHVSGVPLDSDACIQVTERPVGYDC